MYQGLVAVVEFSHQLHQHSCHRISGFLNSCGKQFCDAVSQPVMLFRYEDTHCCHKLGLITKSVAMVLYCNGTVLYCNGTVAM